MSKTSDLIKKHSHQFPEHDYYSGLLETAENNIQTNPDITIETCKSVIEGLSKTVLERTDVTYSTRGRNPDGPPKLFRMACEELSKGVVIDEGFILASSSVVARIAELRNERGDISKGRPVPKEMASDVELARFVFEITDSLCTYFLSKFFVFDWSVHEVIKYDDNLEFNEFLDSQNELPGILRYSKALFEQDITTYEQELQTYLNDLEQES